MTDSMNQTGSHKQRQHWLLIATLLFMGMTVFAACRGSMGDLNTPHGGGFVSAPQTQPYWACATSTPRPTPTDVCHSSPFTGTVGAGTPSPTPDEVCEASEPYPEYTPAPYDYGVFYEHQTVWVPGRTPGEPLMEDGEEFAQAIRIRMKDVVPAESGEHGWCQKYKFDIANYTRQPLSIIIPQRVFVSIKGDDTIYMPTFESYEAVGEHYPVEPEILEPYMCAPADTEAAPGEESCGADNCVCKSFGQIEISVPICLPSAQGERRVGFMIPTTGDAKHGGLQSSYGNTDQVVYFREGDGSHWPCQLSDGTPGNFDDTPDCDCYEHIYEEPLTPEPWPTPAYPPPFPAGSFPGAMGMEIGHISGIPLQSYIGVTGLFGCNSYGVHVPTSVCPTGYFHAGIDLSANTGTPCYNVLPGATIQFAGWNDDGYGNLVITQHGVMKEYYAHLDSFATSELSACYDENLDGQCPDMALVGYTGNTGNSTGPHLHWEVRVNNRPVDPAQYHSSIFKKNEGWAWLGVQDVAAQSEPPAARDPETSPITFYLRWEDGEWVDEDVRMYVYGETEIGVFDKQVAVCEFDNGVCEKELLPGLYTLEFAGQTQYGPVDAYGWANREAWEFEGAEVLYGELATIHFYPHSERGLVLARERGGVHPYFDGNLPPDPPAPSNPLDNLEKVAESAPAGAPTAHTAEPRDTPIAPPTVDTGPDPEFTQQRPIWAVLLVIAVLLIILGLVIVLFLQPRDSL